MKKIEMLLPWGGGLQIPETIVIHSMAEYIRLDAPYKGIPVGTYHASIWLNLLKLSVHALITPTGVSIRHRVDNQMAWHARDHNERTLGIEFLVKGTYNYPEWEERIKTPYLTNEQFHCGQEQIEEWYTGWNIRDVTTHHKLDPDRKPDPGDGFPLNEFLQGV